MNGLFEQTYELRNYSTCRCFYHHDFIAFQLIDDKIFFSRQNAIQTQTQTQAHTLGVYY